MVSDLKSRLKFSQGKLNKLENELENLGPRQFARQSNIKKQIENLKMNIDFYISQIESVTKNDRPGRKINQHKINYIAPLSDRRRL